MSEPIKPDDTAALTVIAENTCAYGMDRGFGSRSIMVNVAQAIADAVCPPGSVVVSRADLLAVLEIAGWYAGAFAITDEDQATIERMRAKTKEASR